MADAAPLGTITVFTLRTKQFHIGFVSIEQEDGTLIEMESIQSETIRQRFVKKSYHGWAFQRWVPFSRHWWETNVARIPDGYRLHHRDGNLLNDFPSNLLLCRGNPSATGRGGSRETQDRRRVNRRKALKRANPLRAREMKSVRAAQLESTAFYPVVHGLDLIIMRPFKTACEVTDELRESIEASLMREEDSPYPEFLREFPNPSLWKISIISGAEIMKHSGHDGLFERYRRYVLDERKRSKKQRQADLVESLLLATLPPDAAHNLGGIPCTAISHPGSLSVPTG